MKVFTICIIACLAISRVFAINPALAAAIAANPDKFAAAAGTAAKEAATIFADYQNWIATLGPEVAYIVNETDHPITFQAFNIKNAFLGLGFNFTNNTVMPGSRQSIQAYGTGTMAMQIISDGYNFGSYKENYMFFCNRGGVYNVRPNPSGKQHKAYVTEMASHTGEEGKRCTGKRLRRRLALNRRLDDATITQGGSFFQKVKDAVDVNPEKYVKAIGTVAKDSLTVAKQVTDIVRNMYFETAKIFNMTDQDIEWFCYNKAMWPKFDTWMKAYMGPHAIVSATCNGIAGLFTTCSCYANNKAPGFDVMSGKVYEYKNGGLSQVGTGVCPA